MVQTEADVLVSALSLAAAVWHQLCHFLTFSCSFTADFGSGLTLVPLQHLLHLEIHPLFYYLFSLAWDSSLFLFLFIYFFPQETNSESNHKTVIPGSTKFKPGRICVLECCSSPSPQVCAHTRTGISHWEMTRSSKRKWTSEIQNPPFCLPRNGWGGRGSAKSPTDPACTPVIVYTQLFEPAGDEKQMRSSTR